MEFGGRQALDPGAAGKGRGGRLRPDGGQHRARGTVPPRRAVRAVAARPRPGNLYIRSARRAAELRPLRRAGVVVAPAAEEVDVDGIAVRLTNPDKVYFPKLGSGGTKRKLVDYYL